VRVEQLESGAIKMTIDNRDEVEAQGRDAALLRTVQRIDAMQRDLDALGTKLEQIRTDTDVLMAQVKVLEQAILKVGRYNAEAGQRSAYR
jgi:hypothetical protein